jgi:hypothetical protein
VTILAVYIFNFTRLSHCVSCASNRIKFCFHLRQSITEPRTSGSSYLQSALVILIHTAYGLSALELHIFWKFFCFSLSVCLSVYLSLPLFHFITSLFYTAYRCYRTNCCHSCFVFEGPSFELWTIHRLLWFKICDFF